MTYRGIFVIQNFYRNSEQLWHICRKNYDYALFDSYLRSAGFMFAEVRFVTARTAGGSVKFLPAV